MPRTSRGMTAAERRPPLHEMTSVLHPIALVVLPAPLDERPHRLGCDQLHLVAEAAQQAAPVMAGTAGLEEHGASRLLLEEPDQLAPVQLAPEHRPATLIEAVDLKDGLRGVQPDHGDRHRGRLLLVFARPD